MSRGQGNLAFTVFQFVNHIPLQCLSQWPRGLRRRSAAARLLKSWVPIPPGAWIFVCCECCVLSGRGLGDELITRPEESYRQWSVVVCDLENLVHEEAMTRVGSQRHKKKFLSSVSVSYPRCIWFVFSNSARLTWSAINYYWNLNCAGIKISSLGGLLLRPATQDIYNQHYS
jgi:hypothetical protein